jgi:hypothetical protein
MERVDRGFRLRRTSARQGLRVERRGKAAVLVYGHQRPHARRCALAMRRAGIAIVGTVAPHSAGGTVRQGRSATLPTIISTPVSTDFHPFLPVSTDFYRFLPTFLKILNHRWTQINTDGVIPFGHHRTGHRTRQVANIQHSTFNAQHSMNTSYPGESDLIRPKKYWRRPPARPANRAQSCRCYLIFRI